MNDKMEQPSPEWTAIEERLRRERATATGLDLDQIKLRALAQARAPRSINRKAQLMKSKLALLMMIVLGLMLSSTGATLAVSGISDQGTSAGAVYPDDDGDDGEVLSDEDRSGGGDPDVGATEPDSASGGDDVQAVAQTGAADDAGSLPFTGFLAIPLLIAGIGLVATGAILRRRA